jgi:hypothetical protein
MSPEMRLVAILSAVGIGYFIALALLSLGI